MEGKSGELGGCAERSTGPESEILENGSVAKSGPLEWKTTPTRMGLEESGGGRLTVPSGQ